MSTIVSETVELEDGVHGSHAIDAPPCMVRALGEHTEDDPAC